MIVMYVTSIFIYVIYNSKMMEYVLKLLKL